MAKKKLDEVNKNDDRLIMNNIKMTDDEPNFSDPEDYVDDITDDGISFFISFNLFISEFQKFRLKATRRDAKCHFIGIYFILYFQNKINRKTNNSNF